MKAMLNRSNKFFLIIIIAITITNKSTFGSEAYFDLSDQEINIETDFNGKEVIIFGLTDPSFDTILVIKGPKKNVKLSMKERLFGFWLETKKIIYHNIPSILFIASSAPIDQILNEDVIIKKGLLFEKLILNVITKRNFIYKSKSDNWDANLIRLQKNKGLYHEYELKIVDEKLFQTRIFFPSSTIPGLYNVSIFQVNNKKIINEKNKRIIVKKTGIGDKIYQFAQKHPASYGILSILFAVISGLAAATAFRRL